MDKSILNAAHRHLRKTDEVMAKIIKQYGTIAPGKSKQPYYHALVVAIINQQLSVKAAGTIEKRLRDIHGGRYFKAETILDLKTTALRECGLSGNKVRYISTLAQAIADGELNFRKLTCKSDNDVRDELMQYPGIGQWSVDMFLMFSMQREDIFPVGDLVIRRSMQKHYKVNDDAKHDTYVAIAESWRPYRSIASFYLWKTSD